MSNELSTAYDPKTTEPEIWRLWEAGRHFHSEPEPGRTPYTIVIPPPNVTGALHMGHALNNTLQDILIRRRRMQGFNALWMPGTDHAGIATQSVVERQVFAQEGKTRHDLGREELVRRIWAWKEQYGSRIIGQLKAMGCSCDWDRTRFTLDDMCAKAVRRTFFDMFAKALIYRGKRLVNWDPALQTAVADDELDDREVQGNFYYIRYPLAEGGGHITVATTRPETMLGDTAVAMNPKDPRAAGLVGKTVILPLVNRPIPIIADDYVTMPDPNSDDAKAKLTTGFLKVTPAHDPNDYEIGRRHKLPLINIFNANASINDNGGAYKGLDRFAARKKVCADLEAAGLLEKVEPHRHTVPHSDRSGVPIEPYLSDQWFVKMDSLAEAAMEAVRDGGVKFSPERYAKSYLDWLGAKRDWCISRQLWWGHRIPVWHFAGTPDGFNALISDLNRHYGDRFDAVISACWIPTGETPYGMICALEDLPADLAAKHGLRQDPDVLDTWFSSALWPHSTLGWPDQTAELAYHYPTSVLVTNRDIITLWVARMVIAGLFNLGRVPFRDVVIHPTILDAFGERMSKSKGNGVDPLDIIGKQGADGMRFTLAGMATETQDVRLPVFFECPHCGEWETNPLKERQKRHDVNDEACAKCKKRFTLPKSTAKPTAEAPQATATSDRFDYGRNFCNKLWNASRFAMMSLEAHGSQPVGLNVEKLEDRWILGKLDDVIRRTDEAMDAFHFADAIGGLYTFFWDDFCAWYLEIIKPRIKDNADAKDKAAAQAVLAYVLDTTLRLLHPAIPFVTEAIWNKLRDVRPNRSLDGKPHGEAGPLLKAAWPEPRGAAGDRATAGFDYLRDIVRSVRNIRNKFKIANNQKVDVVIRVNAGQADFVLAEGDTIRALAGVANLTAGPTAAKPAGAATEVLGDTQVFVPLGGLVDFAAERARLSADREKTAAALAGAEAKLSNAGFVSRAKPDVIEKEKARAEELRTKLAALDRNLADLQ